VKNTFFEWIRTPARLVCTIITAAIVAGLIIGSHIFPIGDGTYLDKAYFKVPCFTYMLFFVFCDVMKGLSKGRTLFDLSDVNMLFTAPVSPKKVLVYGMAGKMAKTMLLTFAVILLQSGWLRYFYLDARGLTLLLVFCVLTSVLVFMLAQVIYSLSNGRKTRKLVVMLVMAALFVPLLVQIVLEVPQHDVDALLELLSVSPLLDFFPVAGWAAASCTAFLTGNMGTALFFLGLILLTIVGLALVIAFKNVDFYEDALYTSETAFALKHSTPESAMGDARGGLKGAIVQKTGLHGAGSTAFFYRHLRELSRRSVLSPLNGLSLFYMSGVLSYTVFLNGTSDADCITLLSVLLCIQIFCITIGDGLRELAAPYLYLIPEPSLSKIIWSNMTAFLRSLVEGLLVFAIAGVVGMNWLMCLLAALSYSFFSCKLIALNYVSRRWIGIGIGAGAFLILYLIIACVTSLPGIIIGMVAAILSGGVWSVGLLSFCVWELVTGFVGFALSAGILDHCDMATMKSDKA
jgi:hypothetical protein